MTRRRVVVLSVGLLLTAVLLAVAMTAASESSPRALSGTPSRVTAAGQPLKRITQTVRTSWTAFCDFDNCAVPTISQISVTMPASSPTVDAVLSITFDYRTSPGDAGRISAGYRAQGQEEFRSMRPDSFLVVSPSSRAPTSTTLTWMRPGLEGGRRYTFVVTATTRDREGNHRVTVAGTKAIGVLEIWAEAPQT
jgi:hypothetical protein